MGIPMFNESWIALSMIVAFLGLILKEPALVIVSSMLLTISGVSWAWSRYSLRSVEYERWFSEKRVFLGESLELIVRVTNRKLLPLSWLRVDDQVPSDLPLVGDEVQLSPQAEIGYLNSVFAVRWYERVNRRYRLQPHRRGFYTFGPVHLHSGDFFGLFEQRTTLQQREWLIVYPEVHPLHKLGLPTKDPFGDSKAYQRIFEDPIRTIGVREYQPEDSFRRIHWKASARLQKFQSRLYEPTTSQQLMICLNVATFAQPWLGIIPEVLEESVSVAASIAHYGVMEKYQVGLLANGSVPGSDQPLKVLPSRDPQQLTRILEALAAVTGYATMAIDRQLTVESPRLPWGSTLLLITSVFYDELLATLLRLRDAGRRLVLVSLSNDCPDLTDHGIRTYVLSGPSGDEFAPPARKIPPSTQLTEATTLRTTRSPWARPAAKDGAP